LRLVCKSAGCIVTGSGGAARSIGCAHAHRTVAVTNAMSKAFMCPSCIRQNNLEKSAFAFSFKEFKLCSANYESQADFHIDGLFQLK
jgi:shikimate 5-dehydrogenase